MTEQPDETIPGNFIDFERIANPEITDGLSVIFFPALGDHGLPEAIGNLATDKSISNIVVPKLLYGEEEEVYWQRLSDWLLNENIDFAKLVFVGFSSGSVTCLSAAAYLDIPANNVVLIGPSTLPVPYAIDQRLLHKSFPSVSPGSKVYSASVMARNAFSRMGILPFAQQLIDQLIINKDRLSSLDEASVDQAVYNTYKYWISPSRLRDLIAIVDPVIVLGDKDKVSRTSVRSIHTDPDRMIKAVGVTHNISDYSDELREYLKIINRS